MKLFKECVFIICLTAGTISGIITALSLLYFEYASDFNIAVGLVDNYRLVLFSFAMLLLTISFFVTCSIIKG